MCSSLTYLVLDHISHLIDEGKLYLVTELGLNQECITALAAFRSEYQLRELCRDVPHFLRPNCIDPELLMRAITVATRRCDERAVQDRMLRQGANFPIMQMFFGWTATQTTARRQVLGLEPHPGGRPSCEPDGLYEAWIRYKDEPDLKIRLLRTAEDLGVPMRNIHNACQEYLQLEEAARQSQKQRSTR